MKFLFCLALTFVVIVAVSSEPCTHKSNCTHVSCDDTSELGCSHNECTCLDIGGSTQCFQKSCTARNQCNGCTCGRLGANREHHCYDNHCTCGRGFGGIGK